MKYRVSYTGFYTIEADSIAEAMETDRGEGEYEEYENTGVIPWEGEEE